MRPGTCIHFTGLRDRNICCAKGVNYSVAFDIDKPGVMLRMPCVQYRIAPANRRGTHVRHGEETIRIEIDRRGETMIPCEHFQEPTAEDVEQDRFETDAFLKRTVVALNVASEWRTKPKPESDRAEIVECPICKGKLHLFQSSRNGHVHGKCETSECVSWIE